MNLNTTKTVSQSSENRSTKRLILTITSVMLCVLLNWARQANAATPPITLCVSTVAKTMHDGQSVVFWGFTRTCGAANGNGVLPGPPVEVGVGETLNLTLSVPMMTTPWETMMGDYRGHTIHMHGADVQTLEDGVPDTGASVTGDTYTWTPTAEMAGTYMYHCHVHTVKHLEMGMYGPLLVVPKDASGNPLRQLTPDIPGKPTLTAYDFIQTYLFSAVDPAYHAADAVGDAPVFADYNPKYFLLNGKESINSSGAAVAAETLTAARNSKVALRLIGLHSVKGTFKILDSNGNAQPFTVYVQDGRQWPAPETVTSLDIGPAQRFDIIFSTPSTSGTWHPQLEYQKLRDSSPGVRAPYVNGTVFGNVTF